MASELTGTRVGVPARWYPLTQFAKVLGGTLRYACRLRNRVQRRDEAAVPDDWVLQSWCPPPASSHALELFCHPARSECIQTGIGCGATIARRPVILSQACDGARVRRCPTPKRMLTEPICDGSLRRPRDEVWLFDWCKSPLGPIAHSTTTQPVSGSKWYETGRLVTCGFVVPDTGARGGS